MPPKNDQQTVYHTVKTPPTPQQLAENLQVTVVDRRSRNKEGWRSVVSTILILIAAPIVALMLITYVFQSYEVDGPSMESTLQHGDRLIVDKIPRTIARITGNAYLPSRGDIIIFIKRGIPEIGLAAEDRQLIKRVIGLPGDRVTIKNGLVAVINKQNPQGFNPDKDPRFKNHIGVDSSREIDITVGPGEVFVLGDNRANSLDSRYFGPIHANDIVGKLSFRIYPLKGAQGF